MKIRYSKKRLYSNLFLGGIFALLASLRLWDHPDHLWLYFLQLFLGLVGVGAYFYERHFQYLHVENGMLTTNNLKRKSVVLKDINKIQSFPGKIKLFTSEEQLNINTELIAEDSRNDLLGILGSLELENNPFIGYSTKTS